MLSMVVCGYTLSPFATAVVLSAAIKNSNIAVMDALVDWQGVRESLRASIMQRLDEKAQVRPDDAGFLEKVKYKLTDTIGPYMVDYMLDERVSPAGFTLYMGPHSPQAEKVRAQGIDPDALPAANTFTRIRRANFVDLTHFQIELVDRWDSEKVYLTELELRGLFWQLTRVDMLALGRGT